MDLGVCLFRSSTARLALLWGQDRLQGAGIAARVRGCLEFGPDMGFVQPGVDFEMGLKFVRRKCCSNAAARSFPAS